MGLKLCLVFLLLAVALAAVPRSYSTFSSPPLPSSSSLDLNGRDWQHYRGSDSLFGGVGGLFGDSEDGPGIRQGGRQLYARGKYLSYAALRKNSIPCGRRGHSYYNCRKRQRANPYTRGCSTITRCARWTD